MTIVVGSRNFFGAERRFFRIVANLRDREKRPVTMHLVINSTLFEVARQQPWAKNLLTELAADGNLTVLPDSVGGLRQTRGLARFVREMFGTNPLHGVLHGRKIAWIRSLYRPGRTTVEITSPNEADGVAARVPYPLLRRVAAIRAVSPAVAKRFAKNLQAKHPGQKAGRVIDRVRVSTSPFVNVAGGAVPAENRDNLIVSASRFEGRKNVLLIARSLAELLPEFPTWKAKLLGKGDEEEEIKRLLGPFIASGQVLVGYDPHPERTLSRSAVYVSMIEPDNYPSQSVSEAICLGNALVLADTGQSPRFIDETSPNGLLVPVSSSALTTALRELLENPRLRKQMQYASLNFAAKKLSADRHVNEFLKQVAPTQETLRPV